MAPTIPFSPQHRSPKEVTAVPISPDRATELVANGQPYRSCCGTQIDSQHLGECAHFRAVERVPISFTRDPGQDHDLGERDQCPVCRMFGFHRPDCPHRTVSAENPKHYEHASGVETIQVSRCMTYTAGSAFKYMMRYEDKSDPPEDLRKSRWYVGDVAEYDDPIWISLTHQVKGVPLLEKMLAYEDNMFRRTFFSAILYPDIEAMAAAVEAARDSLAAQA